MRILKKLVIGIHQSLNAISEWPAFIAILIMVVTVIAGIVARYVFNSPFHFIDEYNGYLYVIVILLPLAWILRHSDHIRIDLVVKALPQRAANYLELATILVSLGLVIVLTIGTTQLVMTSFARGTRAFTFLLTPLGPVQLIMPIGLGLFAIQIMVVIAKRIKTWGTPPEKMTK